MERWAHIFEDGTCVGGPRYFNRWGELAPGHPNNQDIAPNHAKSSADSAGRSAYNPPFLLRRSENLQRLPNSVSYFLRRTTGIVSVLIQSTRRQWPTTTNKRRNVDDCEKGLEAAGNASEEKCDVLLPRSQMQYVSRVVVVVQGVLVRNFLKNLDRHQRRMARNV